MSEKAWHKAFTSGSKDLQARLSRVHAKNPEFQAFITKHGFGGTLSVKQSGKQKKSAAQATVATKPVGSEDRLDIIKKVAMKLRDRHQAASNRAHFGGELGGDFSIGRSGFRRYSESTELNELSKDRLKWYVKHALRNMNDLDDQGGINFKKTVKRAMGVSKAKRKMSEALDYKGLRRLSKPASKAEKAELKTPEDKARFDAVRKKFAKRANIAYLAGKKVNEEVPYKDAKISMKRGGWVAIRDGKQIGVVHPTKELAMKLVDNTHKSFMHKIGKALRKKAKDVARSMDLKRSRLATESAANRRRIRSWDSAVLKDRSNDPPFTPDKPKKNLGVVVGKNDPGYSKARHLARLGLKQQMKRDRINATVDYISNPKYSVLNKNTINSLLKGK